MQLLWMLIIVFGIAMAKKSPSNMETEKIVEEFHFDINQKGTFINSSSIDTKKVHVFTSMLDRTRALDLLIVTFSCSGQLIDPEESDIIQMAVSNGRDSLRISLPDRRSNGTTRLMAARLLNPIQPDDFKLSDHIPIILTITSRKTVDYKLTIAKLDQGQYKVELSSKKPIVRFPFNKLSFVHPVAQRIVQPNDKNVRVFVTSTDELCAMVVTADESVSLYGDPQTQAAASSELRSILFTSRADFELMPLHSAQIVYVFVFDDDSLCDGNASPRAENLKKTLTIVYTLEDNESFTIPLLSFISIFLSPIILLLGKVAVETYKTRSIVLFPNSRSTSPEPHLPLRANRLFDSENLNGAVSSNPYTFEERLLDSENQTPNTSTTSQTGIEQSVEDHGDMEESSFSPLQCNFACFLVPIVVSSALKFYWYSSPEECFHNFGCAKRWLRFTSLNHVFSNVGYAICALIYLAFLALRRSVAARHTTIPLGVYANHPIEFAMGVSLFCEALGSAAYHVCPSKETYQFDTPFIVITCTLVMMKLYGSRHAELQNAHMNPGIAIALASNFFMSELSSWSVFRAITPVLFALLLLGVLGKIYAGKHFLDSGSILRQHPRRLYKTSRGRILLAVLLINLILIGVFTNSPYLDNCQITVFFIVLNMIIYFGYYFFNKIAHKEKLAPFSLITLMISCLLWSGALFSFVLKESDWSVSSAKSRSYNSSCILLNFYDWHDIWHALSAVASLFSLFAVSTIDDQISMVPRANLVVF